MSNKLLRRYSAQQLTSVVILFGSTLMLLMTLHPELILRNNTPTGGDMGAHVYGPAFLRDFLLANFRLTGWSNDWYAGFPMYRFYMLIPALAVVIVDLILPYGVALKIIAVIGILTLPICTWLFGKFAKFAFPIPELLTLSTVVFLYDESFTIYGGNIASTMAGEFSFSIALSLAVLAFGLFVRAMSEHRGRMITATVIALSALSHGIVLLFVFCGVLLLALAWLSRRTIITTGIIIFTSLLLSAFWVMPFLTGHAYMTDMKYEPRPSGPTDSFWKMFFPLPIYWNILITFFALIGFAAFVIRRNRTGIWMGFYCAVLCIGVFVGRESLPVIGLLWNPRLLPFVYLLRYFLMMVGIYETAVWLVRFYQLERVNRRTIELVVDQPISPVVSISRDSRFNLAWITAMTMVVVVIIGFRFQELPFGKIVADSTETRFQWGPISTKASNDGFVDGWARWNFSGYEEKNAYGEYRQLVSTMTDLGNDPALGCGRALWENNGELNKYGTTMSLMLLPHWTKGCIGSMEGLNFEAAGTTPYHFVTAAAMSKQSSNPVRELRYDDNNASLGIGYLQTLGVRYYMAFTVEAIAQADSQPGLARVAVSGPWVIYLVSQSDLVVPLTVQPVIVETASGDAKERWLEVGMSWFQHSNEWSAMPVAAGENNWQKIEATVDLSRREGEPGSPSRRVDIVIPSQLIDVVELEPVSVTNVQLEESAISFAVDKVGVPILVKMSYFPNWKVNGANGPYRVAPNMMVVVPTQQNIRMYYGYSKLDFLSYFLTGCGILFLILRWRHRLARQKMRSGSSN